MLALVTHGRNPRPPVLRGLGATASAAGMSSLATAGIGAGVALAENAIGQWVASSRLRGGQKIATTEIANQFASQMKTLDDAYFAAAPSCANQRTALDAFDQAFNFLQSSDGCGNMQYGSAGERCISERVRGGKYDAVAANRDPIANDPRVAGMCDVSQQVLVTGQDGQLTAISFPDAGSGSPGSTLISPGSVSGGSSLLPLLLGGVLLYLVVK